MTRTSRRLQREATGQGSAALTVRNLVSGYRGGPAVIRGLSLEVHPGEIVAVLGRNGAGKSTLLRTISGLLLAREGEISLGELDLTRLAAHEIASLGVGHVPEGRRLLASMSVLDNLKLGAYPERSRARLHNRLTEVFDLLPALADWQQRVGGTLSGGEQQLVAIARALMGSPSMILLDEPLTGLSPSARSHVLDVLQLIRKSGRAVLIVEQNVAETLPAADRGVIIDGGRVVLSGSAEHLLDNATVQEKHLGVTLQ